MKIQSYRKENFFIHLNITTIKLLLVIGSIFTKLEAEPISKQRNTYLLNGIVFPLMSTKETSKFGFRHHPIHHKTRHHDGIDLAAPNGTPIRSIKEGKIVYADTFGSYGNLITIDHGKGITTHYGHCNKIRVTTGDKIYAGQIIGTVGTTGTTTGAHLHFEIRLNGKPLNPVTAIPFITGNATG
jgi:murein DD-endopeptidase MepM/ murein hydrolase activator NlpD